MNQISSSVFQNYCNKALGQLTEELVDNFENTKDEESRIKLLYKIALKLPLGVTENNGKHLEAAKQFKHKGNAFFAKKDYDNALNSYNYGIIKCPQNSSSERELLTILISNRSATNFETKKYKQVLNDIDYLLEIGNYPPELQYKVWFRKAKCYDALQNVRLSEEAYSEALKSLKHSNLDTKSIEAKVLEIENAKKNKVDVALKQDLVPVVHSEIFLGGQEYVSAHQKIVFDQDDYQGRFAKAIEDIDVGTVIIEENPHCAVVESAHALKNCQYCFISVCQPIACPNCSAVIFCSTVCERLANRSFHKIECPIENCLFQSGASVNCLLALRLISQRHYSYFKDKKNKLKDYLKDNCKKNIIRKKVYRYDDYDNVFFLCRNEAMRDKKELVHYTCMAIYLLRLLKISNYFPFDTKDEELLDEEAFIGCLLLRHLQILQFNAHEVSELKNLPASVDVKISLTNYENTTVGAGLYPTLALFNHSCDPSIVRYNIKNKIVVRTIKPVKAGDIIYENYGPLYMSMPKEERQEVLKSRYWFECLCAPCVELWPMFQEMNENELRIPCKKEGCPFYFTVRMEDDPFLSCDYCGTITPIFSHLKALMMLDEILPEAEKLFSMGQFDNAMKGFLEGLAILFKYTKPPHPEIVKVQQRIRICMIHLGNKSFDYKIQL